MKKWILLPAFCLALSGVTRQEIVYRETPEGKLAMTMFYPDGWTAADRRPGIIFFFGGGFINGDKKQFYSKAGYLASRGMVAASAEYRVKNKHQTSREDALLDCQAAYSWLKSHAGEQGIDPSKLSAGGGSAGAACALSIHQNGERPASFVLFNPAYLETLAPNESLPPSIQFFGTADPYYAAAKAYFQAAPQGRVELFVAKGQPHGFFNDQGDGVWHATTSYLMDSFLASRGFLTGKPTISLPEASKAIMYSEASLRVSPAGKPAQVPEGVSAHLNLEYKSGLLLDVFVPAGAPKPLIVWIHGGGWEQGNKENAPSMKMLDQGFAAASISYRLSQEAAMPAQIEDCLAAIRYLRANASKLGFDGMKIGVWGASAGGHLAALIGTRGIGDDSVQAVVDWFGPTDFRRMSNWPTRIDHNSPVSPESRLIGGPVQQNSLLAGLANPATYAHAGAPPFLIEHGDADPLVPIEQSELLHAALLKVGVSSEFVGLHGAGHGGPEFMSRANLQRVVAFFRRNLR